MSKLLVGIVYGHALLAGVLVPIAQGFAQARSAAAATLIADAVEALGGEERLRSVRRLHLYGYGQFADGFGHSNITGSPHAPQKLGAVNDLERIWDFEHDRYLERQRQNLLFPFAARFGHDFALERRVLDGTTAFELTPEGEAEPGGDARNLAMWKLSNPVAAVRAALAPESLLTNVRVEDGLSLVDVTVASGDVFTLALDWRSKLPQFVRWSGPNRNLGEVTYTVRFTGYALHDGLQLPLGIVAYLDWRNIEFLKLYVNGYVVDGGIPDLAAPASVRTATAARRRGPPQAERVADGIWRLTGGTAVIEFADHLKLFELGGFGGDEETLATINLARSLVPGKPVTHLIVSHAHDDHSSGLRTAVAEGLTIVSRRGNEDIMREVTSRPAPNFPDHLHRNPAGLRFVPVDRHLRFADATRTLDVYHVVANNHMADAVFAFVPGPDVLIEADIGTAAEDWQWWADSYQDNVEHYGLEVKLISPVHHRVTTEPELLEYIEGGRQRVQQRCAEFAARGDYLAGCPAFLPRSRQR